MTMTLEIPQELAQVAEGTPDLQARFIVFLKQQASQSEQKPKEPMEGPKTIREWIDKWAGTLELEPGESRESLRDSAMLDKFGP